MKVTAHRGAGRRGQSWKLSPITWVPFHQFLRIKQQNQVKSEKEKDIFMYIRKYSICVPIKKAMFLQKYVNIHFKSSIVLKI